jgi:hypothetical protein
MLAPATLVISSVTCFQGPSERRIGAAGMNPSADVAEQTTTLLWVVREFIRKGRG